MRRVLLWLPVALYMAAIFYLSAQSSPPGPGMIPDKVAHAVEYFVLAVLLFRAMAGGLPAPLRARWAGLTMLISVGYAFSDEFHQSYVPWRNADVADLFADTIGAAAGLIACWAWHIISASNARLPDSQSDR